MNEPALPETFLASLRERTPARLLVGRAGSAYTTRTFLELRCDHAFARDAVRVELGIDAFGDDFVARWSPLALSTRARTKAEYLARPDLGRTLDDDSRGLVARECPRGVDLQVAIGDGLSAAAVLAQVPSILPALAAQAALRGWSLGRLVFIRHCRVGVLNDLGELTDAAVVVLLIGERPGLATAESLSAYMAHRPRPGHDDSRRNLISNIHARGVSPAEAARRVAALADRMRRRGASGVVIKEDEPGSSV